MSVHTSVFFHVNSILKANGDYFTTIVHCLFEPCTAQDLTQTFSSSCAVCPAVHGAALSLGAPVLHLQRGLGRALLQGDHATGRAAPCERPAARGSAPASQTQEHPASFSPPAVQDPCSRLHRTSDVVPNQAGRLCRRHWPRGGPEPRRLPSGAPIRAAPLISDSHCSSGAQGSGAAGEGSHPRDRTFQRQEQVCAWTHTETMSLLLKGIQKGNLNSNVERLFLTEYNEFRGRKPWFRILSYFLNER